MDNIKKVAWVRDHNDDRQGVPAVGHLSCPCGHSPESHLSPEQGDVKCNCGQVYSWDGWVKRNEANARLRDAAPEMLEALTKIAYEPFGDAEATHAEVLEDITQLARAIVARITGD